MHRNPSTAIGDTFTSGGHHQQQQNHQKLFSWRNSEKLHFFIFLKFHTKQHFETFVTEFQLSCTPFVSWSSQREGELPAIGYL